MSDIIGVKQLDFSQLKLTANLMKLYDQSKQSITNTNIIRAGMSYFLSVEWITRLLKRTNLNPAEIFNTEFENEDILVFYRMLADKYCVLASDWNYNFVKRFEVPDIECISVSRERKDNIQEVDAKYVKVCSGNKSHVKGMQGPYNREDVLEIEGDFNWACLIYMEVPICSGKQIFGHEMAIWKHGDTYSFFDPADGVYSLKDTSCILRNIIDKYTRHCKSDAEQRATIYITELE